MPDVKPQLNRSLGTCSAAHMRCRDPPPTLLLAVRASGGRQPLQRAQHGNQQWAHTATTGFPFTQVQGSLVEHLDMHCAEHRVQHQGRRQAARAECRSLQCNQPCVVVLAEVTQFRQWPNQGAACGAGCSDSPPPAIDWATDSRRDRGPVPSPPPGTSATSSWPPPPTSSPTRRATTSTSAAQD